MRTIIFLLILSLFIFTLSFAQIDKTSDYDDKGRRDPFFSLVDEDGRYILGSSLIYSSEGLDLTGILWDVGGNSSALINNEVVKVGDTTSGYNVEKIGKTSVTVSKDGKEFMIRLSTESEE